MTRLTRSVVDEQTFISMVLAINELQGINNKQLNKEFNKLNTSELNTLKSQLLRLSTKLNISNHIYVGKRVAKGIVAGIKPTTGRALIDGPDIHQWCDIEAIEL